jgi:asparagine synthetase B (glutamine-hydrolysing)
MSGFLGLARVDGEALDANLIDSFHHASQLDQPSPLADRWLSPARDLAITRLHQGILNPGAQPVSSPDGQVLLFLEGEVFNEDLDLNNQPLAILQAYLHEGQALFARLNGQFLLGIVELRQRRLTLVTDRIGTVALFYIRMGDLLAFSPRIKPLLSLPGFKPRLNPEALANFMSTGCLLEGKYLLQDIQLLRQAQVMTVEPHSVKIQPYWTFSYADQRDERDPKVLSQELSELVVQAVKRQTRDSIPYAVPLSGGYDSRSIVSSMRRLNPTQSLKTVTWGDEDHRPDSDVMVAQRLAEHLRTNHSFYRLGAEALPGNFHEYVRLSEARVDSAGNYPEGLGMFRRIRSELGVNLLYRGNEYFGIREAGSRYKEAVYLAFLPTFNLLPRSFKYLYPAVYDTLADLSESQMKRLMRQYRYESFIDTKDHLFINERFYAFHNPLTQLKRHIVEERNPLLDNDVIEFMRRVPTPLRIWKSLFHDVVSCLLPESGKIGICKVISLVDWDHRMQTDAKLQNFIRQTLLENANGFQQWVDRDKLIRFLDQSFTPRHINSRSLQRRVIRKIRKRLDIYELPPSEEIFRLMILKVWAEDYLKDNFDWR